MSVIAWDGKTLAADKQTTRGDMRCTTTKMRRIATGEILAWTGDHAAGLELAQWYEDGADPAKYPETQKGDDWVCLIVVGPQGLRHYEGKPIPIPTLDPFMAYGSGRDFAMGAMAHGASAEEAVRIASRFCTGCGMGVDAMAPIIEADVLRERYREAKERLDTTPLAKPFVKGINETVAQCSRESLFHAMDRGRETITAEFSQTVRRALLDGSNVGFLNRKVEPVSLLFDEIQYSPWRCKDGGDGVCVEALYGGSVVCQWRKKQHFDNDIFALKDIHGSVGLGIDRLESERDAASDILFAQEPPDHL